MSLGKAWWNKAIYGWNDGEAEPSRPMTPGPAAVVLALVALVAFIFIPAAHEGFSAVISTWIPGEQAIFVREIQSLARTAEARQDANTLALVAPMVSSMGLPQMEASARMMDEAVNLDPALTWTYVRGVSSPYVYYGRIPEKHGWMQKLEAWDPDNAMPYLTEASLRSEEIFYGSNLRLAKDALRNDPQWRAAMAKAFAAPRFDPYLSRGSALRQSVFATNNMRRFTDVAAWWWSFYPMGLGEGPEYSRLVLDEAREAMKRGDNATALRDAWSVVHFAERVRASSQNEFVQMQADAMLYPAYEFLQPLEAAAGHTEVAKLLAIENEGFARKKAEQRHRPIAASPYRHFSAASVSLHTGGLGIAFFGVLLIVSLAWLVSGRFASGLRSGRMYRWACSCARFAPAGLAACVALMAFTFAPYREAVNAYFAGATGPAMRETLNTLNANLYSLPDQFMRPLSLGHQGIFFGEVFLLIGLLMAVSIAVALVLYRTVSNRYAARVRVA